LFKLANKLDERRYFRFADQLHATVLSITNNIAEGSGSASDADFANFLNMTRRSVFEVANMLMLLAREGYLQKAETDPPGRSTSGAEQNAPCFSFGVESVTRLQLSP